MPSPLTCFKAYDIRGRIPDELNEDIARRIAAAFAKHLNARRVVVGRDIRLSSPLLAEAVTEGLRASGTDVCAIGECGTEEVYFATDHLKADGGIMVTASHNPKDYNGMKLVREQARPVSGDSGLNDIRSLAESESPLPQARHRGQLERVDTRSAYVDKVLSLVDTAAMKPLRVVVNPGNGGAGAVLDALAADLPLELVKVHFEADGHFPNGVPNPLLPENRDTTREAIRRTGADLGVAWDGDFDRCFLFDEQARFIEGYYIVGLLAEAYLRKAQPGERIVHDPRLTWNTVDIVQAAGGTPVQCKTGHAFIKERMRAENAGYGGEMSAHHYFRDFAYCDSGMIPWLLVAELMSRENQPLSALVDERMRLYPVSGEINRRLKDAGAALDHIEQRYRSQATLTEHVDGLSMAFNDWRFNLRASNTEPVVRLNVETRADDALLERKTQELLDALKPFSA